MPDIALALGASDPCYLREMREQLITIQDDVLGLYPTRVMAHHVPTAVFREVGKQGFQGTREEGRRCSAQVATSSYTLRIDADMLSTENSDRTRERAF